MKLTSFLYGTLVLVSSAYAATAASFDDASSSLTITPTFQAQSSQFTSIPTRNATRPRPSSRPHKHIDTVNNSTGIPSTHEVRTSKLVAFCPQSKHTRNYCYKLNSYVEYCVDKLITCDTSPIRRMLDESIAQNPCQAAVDASDLTKQLCANWYGAAVACQKKDNRNTGSCGHHHTLYLLRELRDFLALGV